MKQFQPIRVTIRDVAEEAGVSIATVSQVFSQKRHVNAETRVRVLAVADRLGYRPSVSARALATGRTGTLALQLSVAGEDMILNASFFGELLPALSLAAVESGYSFVYVPPQSAAFPFTEPLIGQGRVDGALLVDPMFDDPFVASVAASQLPYVSIGRILGANTTTWVDNDHAGICERVLQHLAQHGYTRPALLTIRSKKVSYIVDYISRFSQREDLRIVYASALTEQAALEAAGDALRVADPPDSFFCIHERLGVGVALAASISGVNVPGELGIVALGDGLVARQTVPPLTSVRTFPNRVATAAIEMMDTLLQGQEPAVPVVVSSRLVPRLSTAR